LAAWTNFKGAVTRQGVVSLHEQVEQLFREARNDLYYYILSFGLAAHEAQEIVQDAFLRFYVALKRGDTVENPRAWLFRVAHNMALNAVKRRATRRWFASAWGRSGGQHAENPEEGLIRKQAESKMRRAFAGLSPQQRLCLQLRAEGLRYAEIAKALGVGSSTIGEYVSRAIRNLRKAVHE
jgi:RNA polymerase sigma-70 factor, ECF subfamily